MSPWGIITVISTVPSAFHGTPHRPTSGFILSSQGPKYYPEANDPLIHTSSTDHSPKLHTPASVCWPLSPPTPALSSRRSPALPPGPSPDDSSSRLQASSGPIPTHQDCLSALPSSEVQNPTPRTLHCLLPSNSLAPSLCLPSARGSFWNTVQAQSPAMAPLPAEQSLPAQSVCHVLTCYSIGYYLPSPTHAHTLIHMCAHT